MDVAHGATRLGEIGLKEDAMEKQAIDSEAGRPFPLIVGILNVTPDSFSGDGLTDPSEAVSHGRQLVADGAAIIDIGAESTRPGSVPVPSEEELRRFRPVVPRLSADTFVSIDTYKAVVADEMLGLGARMINDVSALRADTKLAEVIARHNAFVVLMYSKEVDFHPHATVHERHYKDVTAEIAQFLLKRIQFAESVGIRRDRIIVDPGMGRFISHDPRYSLQVIDELARLQELGIDLPIMVGVSRKGFIRQGEDLDLQSQLLAEKALQNGALLVRTHNVRLANTMSAAGPRSQS